MLLLIRSIRVATMACLETRLGFLDQTVDAQMREQQNDDDKGDGDREDMQRREPWCITGRQTHD